MPNEGTPAKRSLTLAAHSTTSVNLAEVVPAAYAAAQVDIDGGGVVVEQSVAKGEIRDPSACATATAPTWYVANGVTTRDATLTYFLYNPYPDDAIVDMDFATNEGRFAPQPLQGLVVRARLAARRRRHRAGAPSHLGRRHDHRPVGAGRGRAPPDVRRQRGGPRVHVGSRGARDRDRVVLPRRPARAAGVRASRRLQPRPRASPRSTSRCGLQSARRRRARRRSRRCSRSACRRSRRRRTTSPATRPSPTACTASSYLRERRADRRRASHEPRRRRGHARRELDARLADHRDAMAARRRRHLRHGRRGGHGPERQRQPTRRSGCRCSRPTASSRSAIRSTVPAGGVRAGEGERLVEQTPLTVLVESRHADRRRARTRLQGRGGHVASARRAALVTQRPARGRRSARRRRRCWIASTS